ncbi:MAG: hypothetical protein HEQ19_31480 [Gloeotrichia echinulata CP02]
MTFVIGHWSLVIGHLSFVICHLSFVITPPCPMPHAPDFSI